MTIDKVFKIGILFLGVCLVAVLSFSIKRYELIRSSDSVAVFDRGSGRLYASNGLKSVVKLDLVRGERTSAPLASTNAKKGTGDYYSEEIEKAFSDLPMKKSPQETHSAPTEQKGFFDDLIPSKDPPSK